MRQPMGRQLGRTQDQLQRPSGGEKNGHPEGKFDRIKTRVLPSRFTKELGVRSFPNVSLPRKEEKMNQLVPTSTFTAEYAGLPSEIADKIVQMVKHRQACD